MAHCYSSPSKPIQPLHERLPSRTLLILGEEVEAICRHPWCPIQCAFTCQGEQLLHYQEAIDGHFQWNSRGHTKGPTFTQQFCAMMGVECGRPKAHLPDGSSGLSALHSPSRGEAPVVKALWYESQYDRTMGKALKISAYMVDFHTPISDTSALELRTKLRLA